MVLGHALSRPLPLQTKLLFRFCGLVTIGRPRPTSERPPSFAFCEAIRSMHWGREKTQPLLPLSRKICRSAGRSKLRNLQREVDTLTYFAFSTKKAPWNESALVLVFPIPVALSLAVWPFVFNWENGLSGE